MSKRSAPKFTRATLVLLPLVTEFERRGGDVEAVLARRRIPLSALSDPTMLVDASACYAAMEDMAESLGDVYFGAKVALETARKGTPAMRDAASNALTLGDFLSRVVVEVSRQVDNVRYLLSLSPDAASLEIKRTIKVSGPTTQVDAIGVTLFVSFIKLGLGATFDPKRILVTVPTTAGIPPDFLPQQALIKSAINGLRISYPPEWQWAPFSLEWQLEERSRGEFRDGDDEGILAHFRNIVKHSIDHEDLPLNRFAEIVGLHPRRIQRVLAAQETSYRQMKDDVRRSIAIDLVSNTDTSIARIAQQVGLSSPSALDRAFKQWTGKTPTRFRSDSIRERDAPIRQVMNPRD